jgi:hypothetical protein
MSDNETVNWLYVLFSNISMLGPALLYWLSWVLIPVGWLANTDLMDTDAILRWLAWAVLAFIASFFQEAWIDEIQDLYNGDGFTFQDTLDDINDATETTVDDIVKSISLGTCYLILDCQIHYE